MTTSSIEIQSGSVAETLDIGREIGSVLAPGDVLGLVGHLGAGKTHLTKGIAAGLGVPDDRMVNSPTFVLVNEYAGRWPLYHLDAYRLKNAGQLEALGFAEMCDGAAVVLVEWADRVSEAMPPGALWIDMSITGETSRSLLLRSDNAAIASRLMSAGLDRRR
jgi:tRNA threonylcarbamoyladenosine biosynthesis protein TsaE